MKKIFCRTALLSALLSATLLPTSAQAQAQTPTASELLLIQQSVNTYCLGRGQGRARILCRCSAVLVSNKLATEGTAGYQENAETIFDQAFESCMSHEDKSFPTTTSRLYQSQPAVEESLRSTAAKP
jgi:hypothetical protein